MNKTMKKIPSNYVSPKFLGLKPEKPQDLKLKQGNVVIIAKITSLEPSKNKAHQGNKIRLITLSRVSDFYL